MQQQAAAFLSGQGLGQGSAGSAGQASVPKNFGDRWESPKALWWSPKRNVGGFCPAGRGGARKTAEKRRGKPARARCFLAPRCRATASASLPAALRGSPAAET